MPLPYPEVFRSGVAFQASWRKRRTCLFVLVLDWLVLGKPRGAPAYLRLGNKLSSEQWEIRTLEGLSEDVNSPLEVDGLMMGRSAPKNELADNEIAALHRACAFLKSDREGSYFQDQLTTNVFSGASVDVGFKHPFGTFVSEVPIQNFVAAKPIVASRIVFSDPPAFNPRPYMDPITLRLYDFPDSNLIPESEAQQLPRVAVRATLKEKLALYRNMAACGRLSPLPREQVDSALLGGLFAVGKDQSRDRLILDRRPQFSGEAQECLGKMHGSRSSVILHRAFQR